MAAYVVLWCPPAEITDAAALRADVATVDHDLASRIQEGASPVAALGAAIRSLDTPKGVSYSVGKRAGGGSAWIRCDSERDARSVRIIGDVPVAVEPTGAIDISPWVPREEAAAIRAAYAHHRVAMTPAQVSQAIAGEMSRRMAVAATRAGSAWLVDDDTGLAALGGVLARHGATLAAHRLAPADVDLYRPTAEAALRTEIDRIIAAAADARAEWRDPERKKMVKKTAEGTQLAALSEAQAKLRVWRDGLKIDVAALDAAIAETAAAVREAFREARDGDVPGGGSGSGSGSASAPPVAMAAAPSLDW
jgi:hypothetical protein